MTLPYEPIAPTLRSTGMKTFHRCRRKFLWIERYGLKRGIDGEALRIGKYVHILLEQHYKGRNAGLAYEYAAGYIDTQRDRLQRQLRDGVLPSGERFEAISRQMTVDLEKAYAAVDAFLAYYPLRKNQEVVATELPFKFHMPGIIQPIEGRIDLVLADKDTRQLTIVDVKTHSMTTQIRAATNVFDVQTHLFYVAGLQHLLDLPAGLRSDPQGLDLDGSSESGIQKKPRELVGYVPGDLKAVEYHLIRKPTIKCCKIDNFELRNYIKRVRKWYDVETNKSPDNPPLASTRQPIYGDPLKDPENILRLQDYDGAATHDPEDLAWFYKTANETECAGIFGICAFLDLCRTDKARAQWEPMLKQSYRQEFRV